MQVIDIRMEIIRTGISVFLKVAFALGFILPWLTSKVRAEYFSCLAHMEDLIDTHTVLLWTLKGFIQAQEKKVQLLKRFAENYAKQHREASRDFQTYIENPINAYLMIKRLTTDLDEVKSKIESDIGEVLATSISNFRDVPVLSFPTEEDLKGAIEALLRIQVTYNLEAASIARGELNGAQCHNNLSARDCFDLGEEAYISNNMKLCKQWMLEALQRYEQGFDEISIKIYTLEYLSYLSHKEGNNQKALELTNELLQLQPTHERAIRNKQNYETLNELNESYGQNKQEGSANSVGYEMHCLFKKDVSLAIASKLVCRYTDKGNAFLRLARVKEEELYFEPQITIYHDVLYDAEIETMKRLAIPEMKRAKVVNYNVPEKVSKVRIGKLAWLKQEFHPHVATVSKRVEAFTGLNLATAEEFQVLNYGIGGQYEPHIDFFMNNEGETYTDRPEGNRIATVVFYMSDVPQGGATVFPKLNVAVRPEKGAALFWYNLKHYGEGYMESLHGSCPVLIGSKWIMSKWIHERGQEFRRPCSPTYD